MRRIARLDRRRNPTARRLYHALVALLRTRRHAHYTTSELLADVTPANGEIGEMRPGTVPGRVFARARVNGACETVGEKLWVLLDV